MITILLFGLTSWWYRSLTTTIANNSTPQAVVAPTARSTATPILSQSEATAPSIPTGEPPTAVPNSGSTTSSILRISDDWFAHICPRYVLPNSIDPKSNKALALDQIKKDAAVNGVLHRQWMPVPDIDLDVKPLFSSVGAKIKITSVVSGNEQIEIGNTISVSVIAQEAPEHVNVLAPACLGAGGAVRQFPGINLESPNTIYNTQSKYTDYDYFFLKSGDFEILDVPFYCHAPGVYYVTLEIPYRYLDNPALISLQSPTAIMCPQSLTVWFYGDPKGKYVNFEPDIIAERSYFWDGKAYRQKP